MIVETESPRSVADKRETQDLVVKFHSESGRLVTLRELMFQFVSEGKKRPMSQIKQSGRRREGTALIRNPQGVLGGSVGEVFWALCWQLRAWSLLCILCLPLSCLLSLLTCSRALCLSKKKTKQPNRHKQQNKASTDWMRPTHTGKSYLHSVHWFTCQSHLETPSETHLEKPLIECLVTVLLIQVET